MTNFIWKVAPVFAGLLLLSSGVCGTLEDSKSDLTGRTVRVTAPGFSARAIEGSLESTANDTLRLIDCRPSLDLQLIPVSTVTRIQVLDGRKGHALAGVLIGAGVGFLTFEVVDALDDESDDGMFQGLSDNLSKFFLGVFTAGGALTGGIVGTCIRSDRWRDVPKDKLQISLVPVAGKRVGLSLALRF